MSRTLHRIHGDADLEIRAAGDGRTLAGLVVPFDTPAPISNRLEGRFQEIFRAGSFARTIRERGSKIQLRVLHDSQRRLPIGRATVLREDTGGLYGEFRVSKTAQGDEVLELVRDGALDGLSVGFRPIRDRDHIRDGTRVIERLEVALSEVSVVSTPAYADARITGLRSVEGPWLSPTDAAARLHQLTRKRT